MLKKENFRRCLLRVVPAITAVSLCSALMVTGTARGSESISNYIVVLSDQVIDPAKVAAEHQLLYDIEPSFIYRQALRGYSALMSEQAASLVAADVRIQSVGADVALDSLAQAIPSGLDRVFDPPTNNSRMSGLTIDSIDDARVDADIAIIDTGIDHTHPDLNVVGGTDCTRATVSGTCVEGLSGDDHGHGTHVAGTAGALDNGIGTVGVAPGARLWSVDVLNRSGGSLSSLLAGIDWVTAKADVIEVANISLRCTYPCEQANLAIKNSVAKGVTHSVAAGNSGVDASYSWPANSPDAITVSALADLDGKSGGIGWLPRCYTSGGDIDDSLASFSNWGPVIDMVAPGVCIYSTLPGGSYDRLSGTSMAAPHVAGAAALLASRPEYKGNPSLIRQALLASGNFDWTDYYRDTIKEPLLEVSTFSPVTVKTAPNQLPKASFTKSCTGGVCTFASTSTDSDGTIQSWFWTFGDGGSGTSSTVAHSYQSAGKYTVTLTVADDRGGVATASQSVTCQSQKGKLSCR